MLREIKTLLDQRGRMTLRELSQHFNMEPDAVEPMLQVLIKKGQVRLVEFGCGTPCSGCTSACREDMLIYELST